MFGNHDASIHDLLAQMPESVPVLPLREAVPFPLSLLPIIVQVPRSVNLVRDVMQDNRLVVLVTSRDAQLDEPMPDEVHQVGSIGVIQRMNEGQDGQVQILVQTLERVRIDDWLTVAPYLQARVSLAPDYEEDDAESVALRHKLLDLSRDIVALMPNVPDQVIETLEQLESNRLLAYVITANSRISLENRLKVLITDSVNDKMRILLEALYEEKQMLEIGQRITQETQRKVSEEQREFFLRRQMDSIRKELGEMNDEAEDAQSYRDKIELADMPDEAKDQAIRELNRLERLSPQSAEYGVIRTYLDWMIDLPWATLTHDNLDIAHARQVLDEDHYGLKDIKERILEFLAVRKLARERATEGQAQTIEGAGVILLFVGPPGVGKTSLGQSIARALGREFTRMSLGGMRDEAEIRGHRRTYIGAMPGRIIQALKRARTRNPVFMLDEVDKVGSDWRGDPASALLEVLDPQQNNAFRDHYLDVDFDLSDVIFIATANQLDTIPGPLRDRMEIIQLDGYTEYDKVRIAQQHLIDRQLTVNSLHQGEVTFDEAALRKLIQDYTREAGVRNLEREIGSIMRKAAIKIASGELDSIAVTPDLVREYLGKPRFRSEAKNRWEVPGVATGLAWTPVGGDVLFIEATRSHGKGNMTITGQLGKVMEESVRIAFSYLKSHAGELGIDISLFEESDFHIHVPEGAVPKDGPSAGITMTTALYSLLIDQPVNSDVAMTGEITLRGQVLPIGGVKMKVMAAHRAGIRTVILPEKNVDDLEDLPQEVLDDMQIIPVDRIAEVLSAAIRPVKLQHDNTVTINQEQVVA